MTEKENHESHQIQPHMDLHISEDGLEARIVLRGKEDPAINYETVMDLLNDYKIVYGVDIIALKKLLIRYSEEGDFERVLSCTAAVGTRSEPGKDGRIEHYIKEPPPVTIDEHGRADYRNISKYQSVDAGQVLAQRFQPEEGVPGISIYGEEITPPEPTSPSLDTGQNIIYASATGEYKALIHGIYVRRKDRIDVSPVLEIPRNVGLESGNVNYEGHVRIGGNIERGSVVSALGNVDVAGTIESGNLNVSGHLQARKGINTRHEGTVRIGEDLAAAYLENSEITVEGNIVIARSIIQSKVTCYGDVSLKASGSTVSGGELLLYGSLEAGSIGNKSETPTKITLGLHFRNAEYYKLHRQDLERAEKEFDHKAEAIEKIKDFVQRARGALSVAKKAEFRVTYKAYKEADELRKRIEEQIREYVTGRYNKEPVKLIAREMLYPGVEIHYRGEVEKIHAPMRSVILKFTPGRDKPEIEAYKKKPGPRHP